jgi:hypothetical protein
MEDLSAIKYLSVIAGMLFLLLTFVNIYFAVKHGRLYKFIKRERALINKHLDELRPYLIFC